MLKRLAILLSFTFLLPAIRSLGVTVCFFVVFCSVNDFLTTRGPIHAKVRMRAYSGSGCVFSPLAAPGGGKKGQIKFSLLWESMGNFCILAVLYADVPPPPVGSIGPWGRGVKYSKIGGGLIRA